MLIIVRVTWAAQSFVNYFPLHWYWGGNPEWLLWVTTCEKILRHGLHENWKRSWWSYDTFIVRIQCVLIKGRMVSQYLSALFILFVFFANNLHSAIITGNACICKHISGPLWACTPPTLYLFKQANGGNMLAFHFTLFYCTSKMYLFLGEVFSLLSHIEKTAS